MPSQGWHGGSIARYATFSNNINDDVVRRAGARFPSSLDGASQLAVNNVEVNDTSISARKPYSACLSSDHKHSAHPGDCSSPAVLTMAMSRVDAPFRKCTAVALRCCSALQGRARKLLLLLQAPKCLAEQYLRLCRPSSRDSTLFAGATSAPCAH